MKPTYENPLETRYSSKEMLFVFSPDFKFTTWRKLWIALAEAQKALGLPITDTQIEDMKAHIEPIDYSVAAAYEKKFRHDVMAHVHTFGEAAREAKPIIHLGATSAFVGDNTDVIQMREGLRLVEKGLINLLDQLKHFSIAHSDLPTLGFTHFQPAQLTTVGKRATLWMMDLLLDYEHLQFVLGGLKLRGIKGTTGTQASFLNLFDGDHEKVKALDSKIAEYFDFPATMPVTGQTYSRKVDSQVLGVLSGIAQSLHKMSNDIRLLQHLKEIEEPFEADQIGSSAMAYKRNPMRSERIAALSRFIINSSMNPQWTQAAQWFERTLDDSANKRLAVPESFLATDAILNIAVNITQNLVVYPRVIEKHIQAELPFMATENIIMEAVKRGGDRQDLHEAIRVHAMAAGKNVKEYGGENDLMERILEDPIFAIQREDLDKLLSPENYIGRSSQQVEEFILEHIDPVLNRHQSLIDRKKRELKV
ncbi:MAG: adenylosuccinate lyase [delta proteobacterium ML8_F1]|nr:MAG: adenylosuccinate lyase [delta proteobacterium ML8_F1]